ncbi:MAG: type VI secretion system baseplate subunit TssF [Paraburkholderia sp.]|jgi:type VI secretion system protein ImpG|nr:type VI secretion system baseplate subunit TssF [Paraburkholderia sp.]
MDHLLPHYERELGLLRRSLAATAARYPKMAARLGIIGDHAEDPHVERLLQSFALLAADLDSQLDDHYPQFTDALLGMAFPQYLRPFPACAIAQLDVSGMVDKLSEFSTTPRGSEFTSKADGNRFRSVYDVTLSPVRIANACYTPATTAVPSDVVLPAGTAGMLSITFEVIRSDFRIEAIPSPLRVHISGPSETVSAAMDVMMLNTGAAFVENAAGRWISLNASPLAAVGHSPAEKLIEEDQTQPALRLLAEYFAFQKKFDFVDVDIRALARAAGPGQQLTLHLAIRRVHPDSWPAQRLAPLSADNFKLFCTPIVNLFRLTVPIKRNPDTGMYPVGAQKTAVASGEIWSVNAVHAVAGAAKTTAIHPFASLMHGSAKNLTGPYWILMQAAATAGSGQNDTAIGLVGLDGQHRVESEIEQITASVTCSNGERPRTTRFGTAQGDLTSEQCVVSRVVMLAAPTEIKRLSREGTGPWQLVSQLAPHSIELTRAGLSELKRTFRQFAALSPALAGLVDGLIDLSHRVKLLWLGKPMPGFVRGLEVTLVVDEKAFVAASLGAFIGVMEQFFAQHAPAINFVQFVALSAHTGAEILRGVPRQGAVPVV